MNDGEGPIVLITCSGLSSAGKCTSRAAAILRQRWPEMIDYHIAASEKDVISVPPEPDGMPLRLIVIDGCEDFCGRKKAEMCGLMPDCHIVATACGVVKSGMNEPEFSEIEAVCRAAEKEMRR